MINRIFVEKKIGFDVEAKSLCKDLQANLGIASLTNLRVLVRYDIEGLSAEDYRRARTTIFSEPQVDNAYDEIAPVTEGLVFAIELLPGQYDQRADFAEQCLQMLEQGEAVKKPIVRAARLIVLEGNISDTQFADIKNYCINPVEAREASLDKPMTLVQAFDIPKSVASIDGFINMDQSELTSLIKNLGLAMDLSDISFCLDYFKNTEKRNPTITEIRVLDTYWSDHCRHTTFLTELADVEIDDDFIKKIYEDYLSHKKPEKPVCLMDIATAPVKRLKSEGKLTNLDESEEINACSIEVMADVDGRPEPWLVMFKNETHNHPTEIEPFGGAATCLGGAIRDPLSGRSYVYQSMRVTGSGDLRKKINETIKGKLPQYKISTTAASGFSSYGNQIGLATGQVAEIYHEGYVAKRMEIGAVIAAAPKENVVREVPTPGDAVILLGGRTGRDGCGGATGSSKAHDEGSLESCGAEVQKGNPPEERKIERLFRKKEVTTLIKRCNDFGAGGVSVAIGELADGLLIDLNAVPKKYEGLDGTELAISESQERMAIVVAAENANRFIAFAKEENLEATQVATVTEEKRLVINWNGNNVVNIDRGFLNTNGANKNAVAKVTKPDISAFFKTQTATDLKTAIINKLSSLNMCSQKGLVENFDSSIGRGTILMPFGGKNQLTPTQAMAAKIPVISGDTNTATIMSYGYNPDLSTLSPFHGSIYAHVEAASKIVATGGDYKQIKFTLQEYYERLGTSPERWGKPLAALLGAYHAQTQMGLAAIGGKDSMSGTFMDIDVPPTLVAFAVCPGKADTIISNEFKAAGHKLVLVSPKKNDNIPDFADMDEKYNKIHRLIENGMVYSAVALGANGLCELVKSTFGNDIGMKVNYNDIFAPMYGSIVLETDCTDIGTVIGETTLGGITFNNTELTIVQAKDAWYNTLENIFPSKFARIHDKPFEYTERSIAKPTTKIAKPTVFIPVFPGTNCEYDTARAFNAAGANVETFVIKNFTSKDVEESIGRLVTHINSSQIVMLAGGFSAGDEPDGSGKFIATAFRNERIMEAVNELLYKRDGLMLGICNGFQALIKLGLVPFGEIRDMDDDCPTLTYNTIGRHISCMAKTRVSSTLSPWFANCKVGDEAIIPISHGEGRFFARDSVIAELVSKGQIATQYVDVNPNGSICAVEGITSPDGRVLGKMAHNERIGKNIAKNIPGNKTQGIFEAGVSYFK